LFFKKNTVPKNIFEKGCFKNTYNFILSTDYWEKAQISAKIGITVKTKTLDMYKLES